MKRTAHQRSKERSIEAFCPPLFDPIDSTLIWNTLLISSVTTASRYRMSRRSTAEETVFELATVPHFQLYIYLLCDVADNNSKRRRTSYEKDPTIFPRTKHDERFK